MSKVVKKMNELSDEELFRFLEYNPEQAERTASTGYSYWKSTFHVFMKKRSTRCILAMLAVILVFMLVQPFLPGQKNPTEIFLNPEDQPSVCQSSSKQHVLVWNQLTRTGSVGAYLV